MRVFRRLANRGFPANGGSLLNAADVRTGLSESSGKRPVSA